MRNHKFLLCISIICLAVLLAGCELPAVYSTPGEPQNKAQDAAYTAAAETIAAQLTLISAPTTAGGTSVAAGTSAASQASPDLTGQPAAPSETLPATSTPLPTNTPIPSDTPTITPTGTHTLTPTATPVLPSPTATTYDPKAALGEPDWTDTFQSSANWPIYTDAHVEMRLANNLLSMTALVADARNPYDAWMLSWPRLDDFYLEAVITPGQCKGLDRYGILVRAPSYNPISAYLFGVSCDGKYSLRIWDGSNYINLITWTPAEAIQPGPDQANLLGLRAEGSKLSLFANDFLLAEFDDQTFTSGYFGLFVGAALTNSFTIQVSKISYWELP